MKDRYPNMDYKVEMVESIMALGFIYQNTGSTNKSLEGIMELVVHLENKLKDPHMRPSTKQEHEEQGMDEIVTCKAFQAGIELRTRYYNDILKEVKSGQSAPGSLSGTWMW